MDHDAERRAALERIDRAVARDTARRRKLAWFFLLLLLVPVVFAAYVLKRGYDERRVVGDKVTKDVTNTFAAQFGDTDTRVSDAEEQVSTLSDRLAADGEELWSALGTVRDRVQGVAERQDLLAVQLTEVASRPDELPKLRETVAGIEQSLAAQQKSIEGMQAEISAILAAIAESPTRPRQYVVKEGQRNDLPDLGMTIDLGQRRGNVIEVAGVVQDGQRLFPASGSTAPQSVELGTPFSFEGIGGERYRAVLNFGLSRILVSDYIGLEVLRIGE